MPAVMSQRWARKHADYGNSPTIPPTTCCRRGRLMAGTLPSSRHAMGADLFFVTLDDGSVQRVTNDPAGAWRPAWLPDSRHLIYVGA